MFRGILDAQARAVGHGVVVRQTDAQGRTDLGTLLAKFIVKLAVDVLDEGIRTPSVLYTGSLSGVSACHHADQTISSSSFEEPGARGPIIVGTHGLVVRGSTKPNCPW